MTKKRPAKRDYKKRMGYDELIQGYKTTGYKLERYGTVKEPFKKKFKYYPLYKIVINPEGKKTLLITAGFHGEEFNGPISLLKIFDEAAAFAKDLGVRLLVYICVNPSGFDLRQRYNASNEKFNNDFLRYKIEKDTWVGTLIKTDEPFLRFKIVDSPAKEVRYLQRDISKYPVPDAVLDVHQQKKNLPMGNVYAYVFNRRPTYRRIIKEIEKIEGVKIVRNDSWKEIADGREIDCLIDQDGLYFLHDGSLNDMFFRLKSKFGVCAETKTTLPLEQVCKVNLIWIKELIKLIANKTKKKKR